MTKTKKSERKTGRVIDPDATFLGNHPRYSIMILFFLYAFFIITPSLLYRSFANLSFILTHMYLFHIINFFSVAILWAIIVPLVLGLPNKRDFIDYAKSIRIAKIKPVLRSIGLGIITAIITLTFMLLANYLATLINGQVGYEPAFLVDPFTINIYTSLMPGIWEEVAFRGVMLVLILKVQKKHLSIIGNGLLFGVFHSVNILAGFLNAIFFGVEYNRENFIPTLFQIVYTSMLGIFLAYMFVKTKMLLPCIIMHYLIDGLSTLVTLNTEPLTWSFLCFMTFVGIGFLPMIINILIVRGFSFWFPEPDDEIIPFFDTFLVREQRLKQYKKDIRSA
ncbi:MAG: CPBP family intramembrane metalloprotease [Candidatus Heimdallarchaeota archaeon]|nr:CPBP family intramembrane metalloprotease [Candidatus Heimdallarchaeota archaeon]MBY8994884.1 CPBP family intramembrane metalloprotease [Candidatus Heimdallarchaeota archaeon]